MTVTTYISVSSLAAKRIGVAKSTNYSYRVGHVDGDCRSLNAY